MTFPAWVPAQENPEVPVNEGFDILAHVAVYGRDPDTTSALTWGVLGGRWAGFAIADGTVTLTASATNHVVVLRSTGVLSVSTAATNWNNLTLYARVYRLTTGAATVTATEDWRAGTGGVHGVAVSGSGVLSVVAGTNVTVNNSDPSNPIVSSTGGGGAREVLSAVRTYFVRTDGSDANTGLADTAGGAFLTIQKAVDVVADTIDNAGFDVTIQIAAGTYTGAVKTRYARGRGITFIQGNVANISQVILSVTSANAVTCTEISDSGWTLRYVELRTTTFGSGVAALRGCVITVSAVAFGACATAHVIAGGGRVALVTSYTINGNANWHIYALEGGVVTAQTVTVTLTGTPNFAQSFLFGVLGGIANLQSMTYSGSATGKRYTLQQRGSFFGSASTTYLPGNVVGTTTAESFYGTGL
jgi:hypothetical protein